MLKKYWEPFIRDNDSNVQQFPKYSPKLAKAFNELTFTDALFFQACLIWRIFAFWTPQRSGRLNSMRLNKTLFFDSSSGQYIFKESPGNIFFNQYLKLDKILIAFIRITEITLFSINTTSNMPNS